MKRLLVVDGTPTGNFLLQCVFCSNQKIMSYFIGKIKFFKKKILRRTTLSEFWRILRIYLEKFGIISMKNFQNQWYFMKKNGEVAENYLFSFRRNLTFWSQNFDYDFKEEWRAITKNFKFIYQICSSKFVIKITFQRPFKISQKLRTRSFSFLLN